MKRQLIKQLYQWQADSARKPLILQGARQVGKTFLIKQFAKEAYDDFICCNFEESPALISLFDQELNPYGLIENLEFIVGKKIRPETTLIIFDEIQLAPRALTSLKYFYEQAPEFHVIAAGSLLGVSIAQPCSFPVGKVNFLELFPFNFIEYLEAVSETMLADFLLNKTDFATITTAIHEKLLYHFNHFLFVGGMPEVLQQFVSNKDLTLVEKTKKEIHQAYSNDFSKYSSPTESIKISNLWQNIPFQLAKENKKFKLTNLEKNTRFGKYELALEWLRKAGLVHLAYNLTTAKSPIKAYAESNKFKLYYLDTGLLTTRLDISSSIVPFVEKLFVEFKGALVENFVAKELLPQFSEYLYYWTSNNSAEVDFVIEVDNKIYPIEVKSGLSGHKKSLMSFQERFNSPLAIRISPYNFKQDGSFVNMPIYASCILKQILSQF